MQAYNFSRKGLYIQVLNEEAAHGTVRGAQEVKFCAFWENSNLCPTIEDIVQGRAKKPKPVHLAAFAAVLAQALSEDDEVHAHFPVVYRWIGEQSAECEIVFAKYVLGLMPARLIADPECASLLGSVATKVGIK